MTITAQSADGVMHQFPDGTDQAVIGKVMKQYAMAQRAPKQSRQIAGGEIDHPGKIVSALAGAGKGFGDTVLGAEQLAGKGLSALGATGAGGALQSDAARGINNLNQQIAPYHQANPISTDVGEIGGGVAALAVPAGDALKAKGAFGVAKSLGKAGVLGAAQGALTPVENDAHFWATKATQTGMGFLGGLAGGAVAHTLSAAVEHGAPAVSSAVKAIWGKENPAAIQGAAIQKILDRFDADAAAGGPTAQNALLLAKAARQNGKPMSLMDFGGENVKGLAGNVARKPGPARAIIASVLDARDKGAAARLNVDISKHLSDGEMQDTAKTLMTARSAAANPLFKKLDDIKPTAEQLSGLNAIIASPEGQKALGTALTTMRRDALRHGVSFAPQARGLYEEIIPKSEKLVSNGTQSTTPVELSSQDLMRQSLTGKTRTAPTSQEILDKSLKGGGQNVFSSTVKNQDTPTGKFGIRPNYPSMPLLHSIKEGLDDNVEELRDPVTGKLPNTKGVNALAGLRDTFRESLKGMFPAYKDALDSWSGPSQSLGALSKGKGAFKLSPNDIAQQYGSLSPSDQQFYRLGMADEIRKRIAQTGMTGNEARSVIKNEWTKLQLRPVFKTDEDFNSFVDAVTSENTMVTTYGQVLKNSLTAARQAEDNSGDLETAAHAIRGGLHAVGGNFLGALHHAYQIKKDLGLRNNPALNAEIARLLTNENPDLFSGPGADFLRRNAGPNARNYLRNAVSSLPSYAAAAGGMAAGNAGANDPNNAVP